MDNKVMSHLGYQGTIEVSIEDGVLHGKILYINDLVTYEADDIEGFKKAFEESVEDYLEFCKDSGVDPDKPVSGSFNVRVGRPLHLAALKQAAIEGKGLNEFVKEALDCHINGRHHEIHHHYAAPAFGFVADEIKLVAKPRARKDIKMEAVH